MTPVWLPRRCLARQASDRREALAWLEKGETKVLCACDLLNEGWDRPATEGAVVYGQAYHVQGAIYLVTGPRHAAVPGKESLMVFDFVGQRQPVQHALLHAPAVPTGRSISPVPWC